MMPFLLVAVQPSELTLLQLQHMLILETNPLADSMDRRHRIYWNPPRSSSFFRRAKTFSGQAVPTEDATDRAEIKGHGKPGATLKATIWQTRSPAGGESVWSALISQGRAGRTYSSSDVLGERFYVGEVASSVRIASQIGAYTVSVEISPIPISTPTAETGVRLARRLLARLVGAISTVGPDAEINGRRVRTRLDSAGVVYASQVDYVVARGWSMAPWPNVMFTPNGQVHAALATRSLSIDGKSRLTRGYAFLGEDEDTYIPIEDLQRLRPWSL